MPWKKRFIFLLGLYGSYGQWEIFHQILNWMYLKPEPCKTRIGNSDKNIWTLAPVNEYCCLKWHFRTTRNGTDKPNQASSSCQLYCDLPCSSLGFLFVSLTEVCLKSIIFLHASLPVFSQLKHAFIWCIYSFTQQFLQQLFGGSHRPPLVQIWNGLSGRRTFNV